MTLLLEGGARTDVSLAGITWGKGFAWETTFFDVTPISHAQMGLVPQMHRSESKMNHSIWFAVPKSYDWLHDTLQSRITGIVT